MKLGVNVCTDVLDPSKKRRIFDIKIETPPSPIKRTGDKQDGRPIMEVDRTGDNFFGVYLSKRQDGR